MYVRTFMYVQNITQYPIPAWSPTRIKYFAFTCYVFAFQKV